MAHEEPVAKTRNPQVTTSSPVIDDDRAVAIATSANRESRPVLEIALEDSGLDAAMLKKLLSPQLLARGGMRAGMPGGG